MKVSAQKWMNSQMLLDKDWLDIPLKSYKQGCVIVGDFFEQATHRLLHIPRACTDGTADICPDLLADKIAVESKAMNLRTSGQYLFYDHQLEMYSKFEEDEQIPVMYALWMYDLGKGNKVGGFFTREKLRDALVPAMVRVFLIPLGLILLLTKNVRAEGGAEDGFRQYPTFFRVRKTKVMDLFDDFVVTPVKGMKVYDREIAMFNVHTPRMKGELK